MSEAPRRLVRRKRPAQAGQPPTAAPDVAVEPRTEVKAPEPEPKSEPEPQKSEEAPAQPLKRLVRKKKTATAVVVPEAGTVEASVPGMEQCADIPIISFGDEPSTEVTRSSSAERLNMGKKKRSADASLSFFDGPDAGDDALQGLVDPEYDLSRVREREARTLLNRGASETNREVFLKEMGAKEGEFERTYVPQQQHTGHENVGTALLLQNELEMSLQATADAVQERATKFDINGCDFGKVEHGPTMYNPDNSGMAHVFGEGNVKLSLAEMVERLEAGYLNVAEGKVNEETGTVVARVTSLMSIIRRESVLDLSTPKVVELVTETAAFLAIDLKRPLGEMLSALAGLVVCSSTGSSSIMSMQGCIIQAVESSRDKSNARYAAKYVVYMIQEGCMSTLLKYLVNEASFRRQWYYSDAEIHDFAVCEEMEKCVAEMEGMERVGTFNESSVIRFSHPPSINRMLSRITDLVDEYLNQVRSWLMSGSDIAHLHMPLFCSIVNVFLDVLLYQESGEIASLESLWELFGAISASECPHRKLVLFRDAYKDVKSKSIIVTGRTALTMTYRIVKEGLLPYVFVFLARLVPPSHTPSPAYWKTDSGNSTTALLFAASLLPLNEVQIDVKEDELIDSLRGKFL